MRESPLFEVRLRRFDRWQLAVMLVAAAAIASVTAWAFAMAKSGDPGNALAFFSAAVVLDLVSFAAARSLLRVPRGVLSCRGGSWRFAPEHGPIRSGGLTVAIDLGSFLLLRLEDAVLGRIWLPVQRRGLEREWHALRCAVHSPPDVAANAAAASPPPE